MRRWLTLTLLLRLACCGASFGAAPVEIRPGSPIPAPAGERNLVPNASFECGTDGWGSAELDLMPGWYGSLNALFGRLDTSTAFHGHSSLKIELTPEKQPVAYDDCFHVERRPIRAPLAANIGWIAVEPGKRYRFSVAMKAAEAGTPARLVARQFRDAPFEKLCAAVDGLGSLLAGLHPQGRGVLRPGRSRSAASQGQPPAARGSDGLARRGAARPARCAGFSR